jgi:hypothetical protein
VRNFVRPVSLRTLHDQFQSPYGALLRNLLALRTKAEREGRAVPDIGADYWRDWRKRNGVQSEDPHDQSGLNRQESERYR